MRDWKQEVRTRLRGVPADPVREAQIVEEIARHLEDRYQSLRAEGLSASEADAAVLQEFADSEVFERQLAAVLPRPPHESGAEAGGARYFDTLWQDVKYGARMLRRTPGFTLVAVVTLALGVGANTAIFSVVNTVMLRPLPYQEPDRLVRLWESNPSKGWPQFAFSHANFLDFRAQNTTFERLAAQAGAGFTLTTGGDAMIVRTFAVTANLLPTLGINPALGRHFRDDEDRPGGNTRVALLTDGLWRRRFNADPAIVGTTITLDRQPYEVVGVMPKELEVAWGGPRIDLYVPLAPDPARSRSDHRLVVIGRLRDGVTLEQAQSELTTIAGRLATQYPASNEGWGVTMATFYDWLIPQANREALLVLLGAVGLVLLIACGNVASLLLARASTREREFSVRAALGAQRSRIIRQLLVESVLLAVLAGGVGILLAFATAKILIAAAPAAVPRIEELSIDRTVIAFAIGLSLLAAFIFGLVPALHTARSSVGESLKEGTRSSTASRGGQRMRSFLVVAEVALSVALLIGAGLLIRSFWRVQQVNPGFTSEHVVSMRVNLPRTTYDTDVKARMFYERLLPELRALPGVVGAATASGIPLDGGNTSTEVTVPGRPPSGDVQPSADWRLVSDGYFRAMGIPLRGRDFTAADALTNDKGEEINRVAIISEETARRYWPGEDPIGKTVILHSFSDSPQTIIGVAGDVRSFGLDAEPRPMVYGPAMLFTRWNPMSVVVRSHGDADAQVVNVRTVVRGIDPEVPVFDVSLVADLLSDSLGSRRFNTYLLACFAAVALVLSCVGLFGVLAYLVAQRTRDIGIRMALGASRPDVFRLIIGQGLRLALVGALAGVVAGYGGAQLLRSLLFSVEPADPLTMVAVPMLLLAVALVACYIPARRATRVDPIIALRAE